MVDTEGSLTAPVVPDDEDLIPSEVLEQRPFTALPVDGPIPPYPFSSSEAMAIPMNQSRGSPVACIIFSVVTGCPGHFSIGASPRAAYRAS